MPKHRNSSVSITFFNLKGFLGTPEFREGGTAGKRSTFSRGEQSAVDFEDLMEVQAAIFNQIIGGADIDGVLFDPMIARINKLDSRYDKFSAFLLDTLTIVNEVRLYKKQSFNLAEQLDILKKKYDRLDKEYRFLQEHCDKYKDEPDESATSINICVNVDVDMDLVYTLYQYFFGYPENGVWDEEKANMIRKILEKKELKTITEPPWGGKAEPGRVRKIRHKGDSVKVKVKKAPRATIQVPIDKEINIGDTEVETTHYILYGLNERDRLAFGQYCTVGAGGPNPEPNRIKGFGSVILAQPCKFYHPPGSVIAIEPQNDGFIEGTIKNVIGVFEKFDIELPLLSTDGATSTIIMTGVFESIIEDGKVKVKCPHVDAGFLDDPPEYICAKCGGGKGCECTVCGLSCCSCDSEIT